MNNFKSKLLSIHKENKESPTNEEVVSLFKNVISFLFPHFASTSINTKEELEERIQSIHSEIISLLHKYSVLCPDNKIKPTAEQLIEFLPELFNQLEKDVTAIFQEDPAAKSKEEVVRCYPGFYAISAYRLANKFLQLGIKIVPRILTEHAHNHTGIDIHPGATIGEYFCIDHGTGVVIGETTIIGNHVKLYQGVTLGALSVIKEDANNKRHPTLEDNVLVYSNATILGGETVIGENCMIGGNVWVTKSVPANSKVYYISDKNQIEKFNSKV